MKAECLVGFLGLVAMWVVLSATCFAQSGNCVVTDKLGSTEMIVSCPDGSKTIDAGGRTDLYRVGDRVDIYGTSGAPGTSGSQPWSPPGPPSIPGR